MALLNRQRILDGVIPHLGHADKNVRQAAITLLLNYSTEFLVKEDQEGRVQIISALSGCLNQERDLQTLLRASIALGNCAHKCPEAASLIQSIGLVWPEESSLQLAANEADVESNKKTIREIKEMLLQ